MKRNFYIGEEWLYYKIYCGKNTANEILSKAISSLVRDLINKNIIYKWFFVRYSDPDFHIRVRFHLCRTEHMFEVVRLLKNSLSNYLENHIIWNLQIENYSRELERYGESTMNLVETLFYYDSEMIIEGLKQDFSHEEYVVLMAKSIDQIFDSFGLTNDIKLQFCKSCSRNFVKEFNLDIIQKKKINHSYENFKNQLINYLDGQNFKNSKRIDKITQEKSSNDLPVISKIRKKDSKKSLDESIILGLVHMSVNRAFKNNQRFKEMIIYDYLYKYYSYRKYKLNELL